MGFNFEVKEASRVGQWSKIAIAGPSGSGKTYSSLLIASGLTRNGRIAVIDTERSSANKYAKILGDKKFSTLELPNFSPGTFVEAIKYLVGQGFDTIIIDSLSLAWSGPNGVLDLVDKAARRSSSGNTFAAWKDINPLLGELSDAILSSPAHVIATLRVKTDYIMETNEKGKQQPKKVGLAPIFKTEFDYDFDIVGNMDQDNYLTISKTRIDFIQGDVVKRPGFEYGRRLREWYDGNDPEPVKLVVEEVATIDPITKLKRIGGLMQRKGVGIDKVMERFVVNPREMNDEQHNKLIEWLEAQEVSDNG